MLIRFNELLHEPFFAPFEEGGGESGAEATNLADSSEADVTEGAEETEVADQSTGKTDADARFAEMRRENERLAAQNKAMEEALGNFFEGDTDQKVIAANAFAQGKTEEEIRKEIEAENELQRLNQENETLNDRIIDLETRTQMEHDLKTIQGIDPNVTSLTELGDDFLDYISAGLDAKQAYYATKAKQGAEKATPPQEVGKVNQSEAPKDYFTREEVQAMSQKEVHKNYDAIRKSMSQWG